MRVFRSKFIIGIRPRSETCVNSAPSGRLNGRTRPGIPARQQRQGERVSAGPANRPERCAEAFAHTAGALDIGMGWNRRFASFDDAAPKILSGQGGSCPFSERTASDQAYQSENEVPKLGGGGLPTNSGARRAQRSVLASRKESRGSCAAKAASACCNFGHSPRSASFCTGRSRSRSAEIPAGSILASASAARIVAQAFARSRCSCRYSTPRRMASVKAARRRLSLGLWNDAIDAFEPLQPCLDVCGGERPAKGVHDLR